MSKKIEPTKLIQKRLTESQLKTLGGNRFVRTKWKTWLVAFIFSMAFMLVYIAFFNKNFIISIVPFVAVVVGYVYTMYKAGKRFWDEIKDKQEPVEIK